MLTARDVMTIDVFSVSKDTPLLEAIEVMLDHGISGLPVVEEDMTLLGIITEKDVLQLYDKPAQTPALTVQDFMTTPAVFFDEHATFDDICRCLIRHHFRRVPVTSNGKVIGIISRPDIAKRILKLVQEQTTGRSG